MSKAALNSFTKTEKSQALNRVALTLCGVGTRDTERLGLNHIRSVLGVTEVLCNSLEQWKTFF